MNESFLKTLINIFHNSGRKKITSKSETIVLIILVIASVFTTGCSDNNNASRDQRKDNVTNPNLQNSDTTKGIEMIYEGMAMVK